MAFDLVTTVGADEAKASPYDTDTVLAMVERTGRLLVVHEATVTGGFKAVKHVLSGTSALSPAVSTQ